MQRIIKISVLGGVLLYGGNDTSIVKEVNLTNIRNGMIYSKEIQIVKSTTLNENNLDTELIHYEFSNGNKFHSKSMIMIKFRGTVNIQEIEDTYQLKLVRKMNSGDYLFQNNSRNTLDTINKVIDEISFNIERISPNLTLNVIMM